MYSGGKTAMKSYPALPISTIASEDDFSDFLTSLGGEVQKLREYAIILKPDQVVGRTPVGGEIDAAQNLAYILAEVLHFKVLLLDIYRFDTQIIGALAAEQLNRLGLYAPPNPVDSLAKLLRMSGVIFGEGGRQSIYDPASFEALWSDELSRDDFICLLAALSRERPVTHTAPGIYICLSHQGMAEAQLENIKSLVECADEVELYIRKLSGSQLADQFRQAVSLISEYGMELVAKDDYGNHIAKSIYDAKIMVHENEYPEIRQTLLRPYLPSSHVFELPDEIYTVYKATSGTYSGLVEDIISSRDMLVSMIHSDEVEECSVLYLNWVFQQLWRIGRRIAEKLKHSPDLEALSVLENDIMSLPIGIEITSSTYYTDLEEGSLTEVALTDVASTAIYYYEYQTGLIKRDLTFQFHPEIGKSLRMISREDIRTTRIPELEDGIRLIMSAIDTGNMVIGYHPPDTSR